MHFNLFDYINRWRHTKGYGVHSPLAFRIVRECLMPDGEYGYYGDGTIEQTLPDDRRLRRHARILLRLACQLGTDRIETVGCDARVLRTLRRVCRSVEFAEYRAGKRNADAVAAFGETTPDFGEDSPALTLDGQDYRIFIWREGMQPIEYKVI